ncbi:MAG: DNA topoisomerase I [Candidatus Bathyarchaeota archaeon]|nr:MAG: DNA topoisomerase I [Candidatus Bathyarchaeota archaeon]
MKQLIHNGVLIPKKPEWKRLLVTWRGKRLDLTREQEEMAVAWARKQGTPYVDDPVFVENFFEDFGKALGLKGKIRQEDFDFTPVMKEVEKERAYKLSLTREEKKKLAADRKVIRLANKEKFGVAWVDGVEVEVGNYISEPSGIFMGRGEHPLRGRWKRGAIDRDITLNLSPDAPRPLGEWKEIVWKAEYMWIAKWNDKLRGKEKYVWLADSSPLKQQKDIDKFNRALELARNWKKVRRHIRSNLKSKDATRRKTATVCYLIDVLKLRVGDEKDPDEADTVGATTLRPEHISFRDKGVAVFDFLGKDAVRWQKRTRLPEPVIQNIQELMGSAESAIFKGVNSRHVSAFLDEVMPELSSKVFRTAHASQVVKDFLGASNVTRAAPEYEKKHVATMANLEAAIVCNHKRKTPKNWQTSLQKKRERLKKLKTKSTPSALKRAKILQYRILAQKETKEYNLGTSLKSYIDPRIYYTWGRRTDYDWKLYYPKALQKKFSWIEERNPKSS